MRYCAPSDSDPAHYVPADGRATFAEGEVPETKYCPECGQITLMVYRWTRRDGIEACRPYFETCDCEVNHA